MPYRAILYFFIPLSLLKLNIYNHEKIIQIQIFTN